MAFGVGLGGLNWLNEGGESQFLRLGQKRVDEEKEYFFGPSSLSFIVTS